MKIFNKICVVPTTVLLLIITAMVSCTGRDSNKFEHTDDLSDQYRNMVQTEFQQRAVCNNADTRYLIIVDYSIPSNKDRLFIWDTEQDKIVEKFWCAHGFGGNSTAEKPEFSNVKGSNCSSLGWFTVDRSTGVSATYGYPYHAVDGLDACNSNARERQILIHSWSSVSHDAAAQIEEPMALDYRSAGCFTTTHLGYETIDRYIKSRQKRILLCAVDGVRKSTVAL